MSSGCEKTVKVWSLVTRKCLHTINCQDGFTNVAAPKIALDKRFLLVSRPDCIEIYDSESGTRKLQLSIVTSSISFGYKERSVV